MATGSSHRLQDEEVEYPGSDGKPMAETDIHAQVMRDLIETLRMHFAADPQVYASGNNLLYYVQGDPHQSVSPDVYVVRGIPKEPMRDTYLLWREGKSPDLVIEVSSRKTRKQDVGRKFELYRDVLRVREYFLFDPREEYLDPSLQGYRLSRKKYVPILAVNGRLPSDVLKLELERDGWQLRLYDPQTEQWLKTPRELGEALAQSQAERKKAERARKKVEAAWKMAEEIRKKTDEALQQEAHARAQVEAENERLRRELESLRRQQP